MDEARVDPLQYAVDAAMQMADTEVERLRVGAALALFRDALRETHAVVPLEPTEAMIVAGVAERHGQPVPEAWSLATANIYRAMLSAARQDTGNG